MQTTERFIGEMERIIGFNNSGKTTLYEFAEKVGISPGNLTRLRGRGNNYVTIEACCRLCSHYGTDPGWLLMGEVRPTGDEPGSVEARIKSLEQTVNTHQAVISKHLHAQLIEDGIVKRPAGHTPNSTVNTFDTKNRKTKKFKKK